MPSRTLQRGDASYQWACSLIIVTRSRRNLRCLEISENQKESGTKADAIFAFAGRETRKRRALELYRRGDAAQLILSVARFEWRRFEALGLDSDGGLTDLVQTIEAPARHFFVRLEPGRTICHAVPKHSLGTMGEARALAEIIDAEGFHRVLILSSPTHLSRCLLALRTFVRIPCELVPIATDEAPAGVVAERVKWAGYLAFSLWFRLFGFPRKF